MVVVLVALLYHLEFQSAPSASAKAQRGDRTALENEDASRQKERATRDQ